MISVDAVQDALRALGDTPNEVAANLLECGIQGTPGNGFKCPIAIYIGLLRGPYHERPKVLVDRWRVSTPRRVTCATPPPVRDFIVAFDEGMYPALGKRGVRYV